MVSQPQTLAAFIPTCAKCGARDVTIHWYPQRMEKPALPCGHPPNFRLILNPKLP